MNEHIAFLVDWALEELNRGDKVKASKLFKLARKMLKRKIGIDN